MLSNVFELLTWLIVPFFLHIVSWYANLILSLNPHTSKYLLHSIDDPVFQCYLWISYWLPLTWLPIATFNRYPIELLNLRLSHLASCYSCYISWLNMPFVRNLFTDHFLHKLFLFIQLHFVNNLFCLYKLHFLIHYPFVLLLLPLPFVQIGFIHVPHFRSTCVFSTIGFHSVWPSALSYAFSQV